ncbi:SDR family oxidoreductase [Paraburkholderia phenoliruptrix]|uniref:3-oxoacyl-[acyl-carrier-protein] reductase FabG n=2 Tax=Paraburkholderia phenoliruptrix TaxID=252970 RepID=A0A6J5KG04_9BURK|nr:SDR family oxidoreductase [Paraburkholderia phenoliruptrix]AFT90284.1 Putative oxidoreductase [Paraburkholderia phenoliruptrix BR3459a]CAB4051704.1 3-oxoacyl-[acyl-carrier-protein] reductase FabG [Paraburkholderia phenoliruptrix]
MELSLRGKVAMVAAASSGLGLATAAELANEGCCLSICGRDKVRLNTAVDRLRDKNTEVIARITDVTDAVDAAAWVTETAKHFGGIDILVTNCGGVPAGPPSSKTPKDFDEAFDQVLLPSINLVTAALPHVRRSRYGRILMIASEAIVRTPAHFSLSGVARAGLVPYCHALVQELSGEPVTINVLAPGAHKTAIHEANRVGDHAAAIRMLEERTPARRLGDPAEFAAVAAFIASARASYVNGTLILIDGGLSASV